MDRDIDTRLIKMQMTEYQGVHYFLHDIKDYGDNGYEEEYKCRTYIFYDFSLSSCIHKNNEYTNLMKVCLCVCVYTMMAHNDGQAKKVLCFYIWYDHLVGFTLRGDSPHYFTKSINRGMRNAVTLIKERFVIGDRESC